MTVRTRIARVRAERGADGILRPHPSFRDGLLRGVNFRVLAYENGDTEAVIQLWGSDNVLLPAGERMPSVAALEAAVATNPNFMRFEATHPKQKPTVGTLRDAATGALIESG